MKIGIVSDSHGKHARLRQALALLAGRGAQVVVHCGDLGNEACLVALSEAGMPAYAVAGNVDLDPPGLLQQARRLGVHMNPQALLVPLEGGQYLAVTHGSDPQAMALMVSQGRYPYLCHGHTHQRRDERVGRTRVINPGALQRGFPPTIALLDTATDSLEFIELP